MKHKIAKNYIYNLIYQALNIITPMITVPYVTRIIMPEEMGIYSTAQVTFTIFAIAASFGISVYGNRSIAMSQDNSELMVDRLRRIFSTQVASTLLFFAASAIFLFLFLDQSVKYIFLVNAFLLFNASIDLTWFFNGLEEFRITITRNIFVKIIALALIFLLVKKPDDIVIYASIYVASGFFGNLSIIFNLKEFAGTYRIFSLKWVDKQVIKEAIPYMIPLLLTQLYVEFGRFFVFAISGEAVTGIYDQALKVVRMMIIMTTALVAVVGPRMSRFVAAKSFDNMRQYYAKVLIFLTLQAFLVAAGIFVVGGDFVAFFFGPEYAGVAPVLLVFSIYPVTYMIEESVTTLMMRPLGRTKTMLIAILVSLGVNGVLNLLLIPSLGATGAAIAMICASLVNSILQLRDCREYILLKPIAKNGALIGVTAVITVLVLLAAKSFISFGSLINFFVYGACCVVLFAGIVMLLSKDIRTNALQYIRGFIGKLKSRKTISGE